MKHYLTEGQIFNVDSRSDAIVKIDVSMDDGTKFSTIVAVGSCFSFTAGSVGATINVDIYSPTLNTGGVLN